MLSNASKSFCLSMYAPTYLCPTGHADAFTIDAKRIQFGDSWMHIGHVINNRLSDCENVSSYKYKFIGQTNLLLCNFSMLDRFTEDSLFNAYCLFILPVGPEHT